MGKIGSLAKFPAGLAGAETPKAQPPRPSKPFIPRRIFAWPEPCGHKSP
jgi:hypothetical protein